MVATQLLIHHVGVQHAMRDGRHDKGDVLMKYEKHSGTVAGSDNRRSFVLEDVEYVYEDDSFASEATGVLHLVHGWPDQAHRPEKVGSSNAHQCAPLTFVALARDPSVSRHGIWTPWGPSRSCLLPCH